MCSFKCLIHLFLGIEQKEHWLFQLNNQMIKVGTKPVKKVMIYGCFLSHVFLL